jgi:hypothetical protein
MLRSSLPWLRRSLMLLSGVALAACADGGDPAARLLQPGAPLADNGTAWHKVAGTMPQFRVSQVVDVTGGVLSYGGYSLTVPAKAVTQPTEFVMESVNGGYLTVRLTATRVGSKLSNDVGEAGFQVPVLLSEQFDAPGGLPEWSRLVIAWERPDGVLEPVPSAINPATKVITGRLSHFSQYVVASD